MALTKCSECGKDVSSAADSCPNCGNPICKTVNHSSGTYCPTCKIRVTPVVTSVGGGSCSVGKRETWKCPRCTTVLHRSGCFVATAAYGDEDLIEVQFLRNFRDEVLSKLRLGRAYIWLYYHLGPYIARIVELVPPLRNAARYILDHIIVLIENKTHLRRSDHRNPMP